VKTLFYHSREGKGFDRTGLGPIERAYQYYVFLRYLKAP